MIAKSGVTKAFKASLLNKENIMKTNELTRAALNWAVAKGEGETDCICYSRMKTFGKPMVGSNNYPDQDSYWPYAPCEDWSQGGPIIEREFIKVDPRKGQWEATIWNEATIQNSAYGPTPLIAAMRCYVAFKLGDDIEVPAELLE
jgi:hypothetical protein